MAENRRGDETDNVTELTDTLASATDNLPEVPKIISPGAHAVLDYGVAATYLGLAAQYRNRNRAAAGLAAANGAMVLALALMTDYPGGVFRTVSFKTHRTMDWIQAALAGFGPLVLGFHNEPEAAAFYGQAMSELGVIAATDWDALPET
jgi:hypothetical protein